MTDLTNERLAAIIEAAGKELRRVCDCERGHNGMGLAGRECDCGPPLVMPDPATIAAMAGEIVKLRAERDTAALHGYTTAVNDLTVFRVKISDPLDRHFETIKQFCLDTLNRNLRAMRQALGGHHDKG